MTTDRNIVLLVVVVLGIVALVSLGGILWLVDHGKSAPDSLIGTLSGSLGAIGALLAKTSTEPPAS